MGELTADRVREALQYDKSSGRFTWLIKASTKTRVGSLAGCVRRGYLRIKLNGYPYSAHRLAWLWVTGAWPTGHVDHINRNKGDNRWANLRDVSASINAQNRLHASSNSSTGILGVSPYMGRFRAVIFAGGKQIYLGLFATPELAREAHLRAKRQYHKGCAL